MSAQAVPEWDLSDRLRKSLRTAGVSVQDMADELGVHRNTVSGYMNGQHSPSKAVLRVWAMRTGVPFEWIIHGQAAPLVTGGYPHSPLSGRAA